MAACAFGEHGDLGADVDAGGEAGLVRPVLRHAHVADAHADHAAVLGMQGLGGSEAGIDLHAQRFGLRRQPGAHRAEADDHVAVVVHARRHRQLAAAGLGQQPEFVFGRRHADRRRVVAPLRQQLVERAGLDHRAGEDLRADGRGLLDHADADLGVQLLEADRERQTGRAGADGDDVVLHDVAFDIGLRVFAHLAAPAGCDLWGRDLSQAVDFRGLRRPGQIGSMRMMYM